MEKHSEPRRRRTLPSADLSTPPPHPPLVDDVDDVVVDVARAQHRNTNNNKEKGVRGKNKDAAPPPPTETPCDFDGRSYLPELCSILAPEHISQPHHIEGLVRFLTRVWGFIGARRAIRRYGVEDVNHLAVEIQRVRVDTALGGSGRHINDPAAFLHHALQSLEEDRRSS